MWLFLAITTGLSGAELYKLNDQEASTIFIALVFFFGTGWVISTRVCNQWVNVAYIVLLTLTAWWLYKRLGDFKDQTQAKRARRTRRGTSRIVGISGTDDRNQEHK